MLLTADCPNARDFEVRDITGRAIGGVMSYCSQTKMVEMYVFDHKGKPVAGACGEEVVTAKFVLEGSYLYCKKTKRSIAA